MEAIMEEKIIEVGMAEMKIAKSPAKLITRALGSCLGVTLYDPLKKIGGMAHAMLPDFDKARLKNNPDRFVNSAIKNMLDGLIKSGSSRDKIVGKIFGGAQMFSFITPESTLNIGQKNVEVARAVLAELDIKVVAEETGGTFGRTITLNLDNGKVLVNTVSWGEKEV